MWHEHARGLDIGLHQGRTPFQAGRISLLCLHGAGGEALLFRPQLSGLSRAVNIAALDLPGHGRTPGPSYELIEDYAAWVADVIQCGPIRPLLLGHSMGGAVALSLAVSHPELIQGLVLSSSGARLPVSPDLLRGFKDDYAKTVDEFLRLAYAPGTPSPLLAQAKKQLLKTPARVMLGDFIACARFDLTERIFGLEMPTLVMVGTRDRMTPPKYSSALSQAIPGARLEIIEGAGHILNLENPAAYNQAIKDFAAALSLP